MTSTGEDTEPSTEVIAPVRPPGENSGPPSQINDAPGQELNLQAAFVKLSADFGKLTTHLGQICEHLPIPDAWENHDPPGSRAQVENGATIGPLQTLRKIPHPGTKRQRMM